MNMRTKVLICMPTPGTVKTRTTNSLVGLVAFTIENGVAELGFHFDEKCSAIARARNRMAEYGKSKGVDYVFFIDSDMQFPNDALARLVAHDRDVCGVFYNKRTLEFDPVGQPYDLNRDYSGSGLVEASSLGCGLLLIRTSVFDRLKAPWFYFQRDRDEGEDYNFIRDCREAGIIAWADLDLSFEVSHVGEFAVGWKRTAVGSAPVLDLR
jgi:glycosyltransferase involved in cell wall biosynthesis